MGGWEGRKAVIRCESSSGRMEDRLREFSETTSVGTSWMVGIVRSLDFG